MRFAILSLFMLLMPRTAPALDVGVDLMTGVNLAMAFHQTPDPWVPDKQEGLSTDFRAGYALQVGPVLDFDDDGSFLVSFGPKAINGSPRSDIPENHFGWWGGYVNALDCNDGDLLWVCMGMQVEVGTLVPYDHQWQIVEHPNGNKAGQISLFLGQVFHIRSKRSKHDRVPFTFSDGIYVLAGLGYSFGNNQARTEETPVLEIGTAF